MDEVKWKLVVIESPYAGTLEDVEKNLAYLRACMRDCLMRFEAPYASHGLYTQPGVLDDNIPAQRKLGMEAGFAWGEKAELTVVYIDRGISPGMKSGIEGAIKVSRPIVYRTLLGKWEWSHDKKDIVLEAMLDIINQRKHTFHEPWL